MQSKLLRSIQERRIRPLGSTQEDVVDVRIVSATHKDLVREVHSGSFRQDLYYRLNVIEIVVPPLRERREDLPALCDALLERIARESGTIAPVMSPDALRLLLCHPLQGNVRELENLLHRALALGTGGELHLDDPDMPADLPALAPQETASPLTGEVIPEDLQILARRAGTVSDHHESAQQHRLQPDGGRGATRTQPAANALPHVSPGDHRTLDGRRYAMTLA